MNQHLNLFRFYNESPSLEFIENNLSRAFSLTLLNSSLFFNEFIKEIISIEHYDYLFSTYSEDSFFDIDIQVDTAKIAEENYYKVYAVALTSNQKIDMNNFFQEQKYEGKTITDIVITIKDILLIIEVKKSGEDCKNQLFNQVYPFIDRETEKIEVIPVAHTWHKIVTSMEKVYNVEKLVSKNGSVFLRDFLHFAEIKRHDWFKPKPFNALKFSTRGKDYHHLIKRLKQAMSNCKYPLLDYSDRLGISVPFSWASEIIPHVHSYDNDAYKNYVVFYVWPGNTKTQGYSIYNKPLNWLKKSNILVGGSSYEMNIVYDIKICHFNKYVTSLQYSEDDLLKPLHTSDNFYHKSGKWNIDYWGEFESFLDDHFKVEFNWREKLQWDEKLLNTDRTYFTMSLGFEVTTYIPYQEFRELDKKEDDIINITKKIDQLINAYEQLMK